MTTKRRAERTGAPRRMHQHYTEEERQAIVDDLCDHLTTHGVGTMLDHLAAKGVLWGTVYWWMMQDADIRLRIRDAQFAGTFVTAEQILRIADDTHDDYELDDKGRLRVNPETVARAKLRIDARWRLLSCIAPSVWGTRLAVTGGPLDPTERPSDAPGLTDAERIHRVQQLVQLAEGRPKITIVDDENGPIE